MSIEQNIVKYSEASADILSILESGAINNEILKDKIIDYMYRNKISSLNTYSWEDLSEIASSGLAPELFSIGDTRLMEIRGKIYNAVLLAFNYDRIALNPESEAYKKYNNNTGLAGMTFGLKEVYEDFFQFEGLNRNNYNYDATVINSILNNYMLELLEEDLQIVMMDIYRNYDGEDKQFKMYLPTEYEILGKNTFGTDNTEVFKQYPYYVEYPENIKKYDITSKRSNYWTATKCNKNNTSYVYISSGGSSNYSKALNTTINVSFCFCL